MLACRRLCRCRITLLGIRHFPLAALRACDLRGICAAHSIKINFLSLIVYGL
jgi:hypothetical protein